MARRQPLAEFNHYERFKMTTSNSFAASASHKPLNPNYPEGDLYTPIEYLDYKGEDLIAASHIHVGSNTSGGGLKMETPDIGEITYQLVNDVASGALTKEQALEAKFVRVPDFGNTHFTRFDIETYASLKVFGLYKEARDEAKLAIAKEIYPAGYEAHLKRAVAAAPASVLG